MLPQIPLPPSSSIYSFSMSYYSVPPRLHTEMVISSILLSPQSVPLPTFVNFEVPSYDHNFLSFCIPLCLATSNLALWFHRGLQSLNHLVLSQAINTALATLSFPCLDLLVNQFISTISSSLESFVSSSYHCSCPAKPQPGITSTIYYPCPIHMLLNKSGDKQETADWTQYKFMLCNLKWASLWQAIPLVSAYLTLYATHHSGI